eukprot:CAMPEP_0205811372 /NCGR_PEP_ID=MMETSP0205-20121125/15557_1 /ASSEMBLY_ACC=CAM_ASM_000278 /TAXON_ID=36767 /ORGANISM="Euplotes focardii, Strain TN1" /LENGTH=65 /DNA_ID=CAMNT_0053090447 /DNA_START=64 /DNA_END=258 /DNA_ORIENTATION=-
MAKAKTEVPVTDSGIYLQKDREARTIHMPKYDDTIYKKYEKEKKEKLEETPEEEKEKGTKEKGAK